MTNSPSHAHPLQSGFVLHSEAVKPCVYSGSSPRAGTLARPNQIRTGHFLFQPLYNISGSITNPNEAKFCPVYLARRTDPAHRRFSSAKSGPLPFHHVNHVSHSTLLNSKSRKLETKENGFAKKHKVLWQRGS